MQGEIGQLLALLQVPRHHVEYRKFYVNSNAKHRHQIFLALQPQQERLSLRHQHIPDRLHRESSRISEKLLIQIPHE